MISSDICNAVKRNARQHFVSWTLNSYNCSYNSSNLFQLNSSNSIPSSLNSLRSKHPRVDQKEARSLVSRRIRLDPGQRNVAGRCMSRLGEPADAK